MQTNGDLNKLNAYYQQVQDIILKRQDWVSGLLPASTAVNVHGNYTDAWVRDNVYSIMSAWGLALAYRRTGEDSGKTYLLEQSVVKLMRGLLTAMMRQAPKVEKFKHTQNPLDALHAKYDTKSGAVVVGDHEWGHLQLDATSLFLLMLAQMTASGLRIIFTLNEVNFVQNLVHYISRTYRTPDYGIWERGNKINHGIAELNASSIGMAKAALEALSGFNLFGKEGDQASVIHVISDDIARTRITLESLLPRESLSKETDSALLSITGFPAFAIDNPSIRQLTETTVCEKLEGRYGCKRFLLDGHQTVIEDSSRLHYDPQELKQFQSIECEWPLFFTYLLLNKLFSGDYASAEVYREKLESLLVEQNGQGLLPELYFVPKNLIADEKALPNSQPREANENIPLVWAQSLFILGCLIQDGLLDVADIDPLGRHQATPPPFTKLQVALLAQDESVQANLLADSIFTQTLAEIAPIQVREAIELADAYTHVGRNDSVGLTGRPLRQLRTLATSRLYILSGEKLVFLPQCLSQKGFYLAMDNRLLIQRLSVEFSYLAKHWNSTSNPLLVMNIRQNMLENQNRAELIRFIQALQQGRYQGINVEVGLLNNFIASSSFEKINYLHDFQFSAATWEESERPCQNLLPFSSQPPTPLPSTQLTDWEIGDDSHLLAVLTENSNLYAQLEALNLLANRHGLSFITPFTDADGKACTVENLLEEIYTRAGDQHLWYIVRRAAGLLGKYDINLEQSATELLVRQHQLTLGRVYSGKATLKRPADSSEILQIISTFNTDPSERIIIQELILYLGLLIKSNPELFTDMHTVRVGHILQLLIAKLQRENHCGALGQAFNLLLSLAPYELSQKLKETLEDLGNTEDQLSLAESLHYEGDCQALGSSRFPASSDPKNCGDTDNWYEWREQKGSVGRESKAFFANVWTILHHCKGLVIGDKFNSKNCLESDIILSQNTPGEQSFKLHVNHLLNKIQSPVYRQLHVEALKAIATVISSHPVHIDDILVIDILIGHAVRISWLQTHPDHKDRYDDYKTLAWQAFYQQPPHHVANAMLDALIHLLDHH